MKATYIEFKKERDLGETLTDTFAFFRNELKPFFRVYFAILWPFLIAILVFSVLLTYLALDVFTLSIQGDMDISSIIAVALLYIVSTITFVAVYCLSQSAVLHYIKSYIHGNGLTDAATIKKEVYRSFWPFMGLGTMVGISLLIGIILCILPGVFLYVPLSLSFCLMVFGNKNAQDAYSSSFAFVKEEWLMTFVTMLVVGIILMVATYFFSLPAVLFQWIEMGIFSGGSNPMGMLDTFQNPVYIVLRLISLVAQIVLNLVLLIATAFIYFNINEKKNHTGTFEQIDNLGETRDN